MKMPATSSRYYLEEEQSCDYDGGGNGRDGLTVECICPKCGISHRMKLLWSGRGKPKKYCQPCKGFVSSMETIDFCGIPADVHKNIEKAV